MKNSLQILILIFLLLQCHQVDAQCNYELQEIDKFSGAEKLKTEQVEIAKNLKLKRDGVFKFYYINLAAGKESDQRKLWFVYRVDGSFRFIGANGDHIILLFENEKQVKLPVEKNVPFTSSRKKGTGIEYFQDFNLTKEAYNMLKNHSITDIRVVSIVNRFDLAIEEEDREKIKELFRCI